MRLLLLLLLILAGLIQYPLWVGRGGWLSVWDMQEQVASQRSINEGLRARNQALSAEVEDLRTGTEAAEERARAELSMMRQGELFVQILPPDVKAPEVKLNTKPGAKGAVTAPAPATGLTKPATPAKSDTSSKPATPPAKPSATPPVKPQVSQR
jgi:cell division protein FtsB